MSPLLFQPQYLVLLVPITFQSIILIDPMITAFGGSDRVHVRRTTLLRRLHISRPAAFQYSTPLCQDVKSLKAADRANIPTSHNLQKFCTLICIVYKNELFKGVCLVARGASRMQAKPRE
jgi:hypothetical protein